MNGKLLAQGQIPATETALYTVPSGTTTYIKSIEIFNTSGTTQTVIVYVKDGSNPSRVIARGQLLQNYRLESDTPYVLESGDSLRAETTTGSVVDYTIYGVEEA